MAPVISFINTQVADFRKTVLHNPLFHYRWQRFSIYNWFNLMVLCTLMLYVFAALVRFVHYFEARNILRKCPDFQRELFANTLPVEWRFAFFPTIPEIVWVALQHGAFVLLYMLFLLSVAKDLWLWHCPRWDHPASEHVRMLPISQDQAHFALADLRFCVMSACIIFCTFLFLLPTTDLRSYLKYVLLVDINIKKYALNTVWLWVVILAIYRTVQLQKGRSINIFANPMFGRWVIAILLGISLPVVFMLVRRLIWGRPHSFYDYSDDYQGLLISYIYYSTIAAAIFLFISCWRLKHRLFTQQN